MHASIKILARTATPVSHELNGNASFIEKPSTVHTVAIPVTMANLGPNYLLSVYSSFNPPSLLFHFTQKDTKVLSSKLTLPGAIPFVPLN